MKKTKKNGRARVILGVAAVALPVGAAFLLVRATSAPAPIETVASIELPRPVVARAAAAPIVAPGESRTAAPVTESPVVAPRAEVVAPKKVDAPRSLDSVLAELRAASSKGDDAQSTRLREELLAMITDGDVGETGKKLIAALRSAKDADEAELIASVIAESDEIATRPEVLSALADMAEHDDLAGRRAAAVRALGEIPGADADRLAQVAKIARADKDEDVRQAAAFSLGELGERSPGKLATQAARALVDGLAAEASGAVRTGLIYSVRDTRDPVVVDALLGAVQKDGEIAARQAAADILGDVAPAFRDRTMQALATRFEAEEDRDMKLTLLTSIIRAGRENAATTLESLKPRAGALAADIDDYLDGLRSGETDIEKLYALKQEREQSRGVMPGDVHQDE